MHTHARMTQRGRVRPMARRFAYARACLAGGVSLFVVGCSTPILSALDEPEANRVMLALDRAHVAASKEIDAIAEGKFRVLVPNADAPRALAALRSEELPRSRPASMLDSAGKGSLVPSPVAEHAQLAMGIAGELERSLETVDGVLSARVHLNLPSPDPLRDAPREKATASVLIAHRGTTPPLSEAAVQRLVAGGAPSLATPDVAVVMVPRGPIAVEEGFMAKLGPFGVARASLRPIQVTLVTLLAVLACLAGALALIGSRLARLGRARTIASDEARKGRSEATGS